MSQIKRKILSVLSAAAIALSMGACGSDSTQKQHHGSDQVPVTLSATQNTWGWGYEIAVNGKLFIKQDYIPVIPGKKGFASKEQALFVGKRAVEKMKGGNFPTITRKDLIDAGIEEAKDSVYKPK